MTAEGAGEVAACGDLDVDVQRDGTGIAIRHTGIPLESVLRVDIVLGRLPFSEALGAVQDAEGVQALLRLRLRILGV